MNPSHPPSPSRLSSALEPLLAVAAWGAVALGAILLLGVCLPHRAQARAKEAQLDALLAQIARQTPLRSTLEMRADVERARETEARLVAETKHWLERLNTFSNVKKAPEFVAHQEDGRIDFKIALFNARTDLLALAESRDARIPPALGIDETLSTDTRVETALSELSATVRLVERVIEAGIQDVVRIQPLPSRLKTLQGDSLERLREYPVALEAQGSFEQALQLLSLMGHPDSGFALRHLFLEKITLHPPDHALTLRLVVAAGRPLPPESFDPVPEQDASAPPTTNLAPSPHARKGKRTAPGDAGTIALATNALIQENRQ